MKNKLITGITTIITILLLANTTLAQTPPNLQPIQDQKIQCNQEFSTINLHSHTIDPDTNLSEMHYETYDNYDFNINIQDGIATINHPQGEPRTEYIGFRVTDPTGLTDTGKAEFSVQNCIQTQNTDSNITHPHPEHPRPPRPPRGTHFQGVQFFPDQYQTHPPETCAISTGHGLLDDLDCDKIPDKKDNCPQTPNPRQLDQNKNGLGNACDITIQRMDIANNKLTCGRATVINAQITNNRKIGFKTVKATLTSQNLALEQTKYIDNLEPGSAQRVELTSRIPLQAEPGSYNLNLNLQYHVADRLEHTSTSKNIQVQEGTCKQQPQDSLVAVKEIQDIKPGKTAVYPIKITNTHDRAYSYTFDVKGIDFGYYSIDPGSLTIIEPGETKTIYLNVYANQQAKEGEKTFVFEVNKEKEAEQIVLVASILPNEEKQSSYTWLWTIAFLIAILVVLITWFFKDNEIEDLKAFLPSTKQR